VKKLEIENNSLSQTRQNLETQLSEALTKLKKIESNTSNSKELNRK